MKKIFIYIRDVKLFDSKLFGWELGNIGWIFLIGLMIAEKGFDMNISVWLWLTPIPLFLYSLIKSIRSRNNY